MSPAYSWEKGQTFWGLFTRFLVPDVPHWWVVVLIYLEILSSLFILLGFAGAVIQAGMQRSRVLLDSMVKVLPFMGIFIVMTFPVGFARLALPIAPLFLIVAVHFWLAVVKKHTRWLEAL